MNNKNPNIETPKGTYIPSKLAQRCPVCNGFGTVKYGAKTCQGCNGSGYVLVPAIRSEEIDGESYGRET